MKKHLFWLGAIAFVFAACSEDALTPDNKTEEPVAPEQPVVEPTYTTVNLASFDGSQSRVTVVPESRDPKEGSLTLFAEIANLSKEGKIEGFEKEGRYLSATSVYFDKSTGKYYVTYHMQGNNYNTTQKDETSGYIETFTLDENNKPVMEKIYMASNPSELDFDFNHIYFDDLNATPYVGDYTYDKSEGTRLITVGHISRPTSTGKTDTKAMIARLNLDNNEIQYRVVNTGDKILDSDGKSLGDEDAGDVNCVVRKYNHYYLATRKGIAVLKADGENLFDPELDANNHNYFLKTPGSAKYISQPTTTSYVDFLFLTQDTPKDFDGMTSIPANVARLAIDSRYGTDWFVDIESVEDFDWNSGKFWPQITGPIESVMPVDGKNMLVTSSLNTAAIYVCLGKNGLYVHNPTHNYNYNHKILKFSDDKENGSRPVNGVFVEDWDDANGLHYTDGFIYVANGACLTILDALTLEEVAEYSAFGEGDASANFIHVERIDSSTNENAPDRIITVAYGQAGVKVFKFVPPTKK